jgi:capsular polysaccharide transport system ATP-binding protein
MISLRSVSHVLGNGREILSGTDLDIPAGRSVALLGRQSAGKSTVLSLLAGNIAPHRGRIQRSSKVSYVAGFQGGFRVTQTGRQNIIFAARAYGADPQEVFDFVRSVTGFGAALDVPLRLLSLPNRNNLSYVLAYALSFDIYLFDNVIGPILSEIPDFAGICQEMYQRRMADAGCIIATRNPYVAQKYCDCAILLRDRQLLFFDDLREAVAIFNNDLLAADDVPMPDGWSEAPADADNDD